MTEKGIINLEGYMSKLSFSRIKSYFYLFNTLYAFNFERFEEMQLRSSYEKKSHFDKIQLLNEQGLIKNFNIQDLGIREEEITNNENCVEILNLLTFLNEDIKATEEKLLKCKNNKESLELYNQFRKKNFDLIGLKERLYSLLYFEKYNINLHPTHSLDSYQNLKLSSQKSDVYRILIKQFPIPDESVPLNDIIQYREEESNQLNFLRLKKWANNISKSNLTESEIIEEIEYLILENKREMKLAGMKFKNAKIEFTIKVIPSFLENLIKWNLSELLNPWFKLRNEKISLLQTENKAKGNELAYILKA